MTHIIFLRSKQYRCTLRTWGWLGENLLKYLVDMLTQFYKLSEIWYNPFWNGAESRSRSMLKPFSRFGGSLFGGYWRVYLSNQSTTTSGWGLVLLFLLVHLGFVQENQILVTFLYTLHDTVDCCHTVLSFLCSVNENLFVFEGEWYNICAVVHAGLKWWIQFIPRIDSYPYSRQILNILFSLSCLISNMTPLLSVFFRTVAHFDG